ncbi:hypothetical protein FGO68_gene16834 [Halteria grandinella]|uniref:Uncharacterized protein n=1 Tax=Halteria grandinella TaxID=5974 RepID=A0A8J8NBJ1_HALGN|nr:hypothetical protein FGO68_gene16834 [Halteria grandinella]
MFLTWGVLLVSLTTNCVIFTQAEKPFSLGTRLGDSESAFTFGRRVNSQEMCAAPWKFLLGSSLVRCLLETVLDVSAFVVQLLNVETARHFKQYELGCGLSNNLADLCPASICCLELLKVSGIIEDSVDN